MATLEEQAKQYGEAFKYEEFQSEVIAAFRAGFRQAIADAAKVAKLAEQAAIRDRHVACTDQASNIASSIAALAPPA